MRRHERETRIRAINHEILAFSYRDENYNKMCEKKNALLKELYELLAKRSK